MTLTLPAHSNQTFQWALPGNPGARPFDYLAARPAALAAVPVLLDAQAAAACHEATVAISVAEHSLAAHDPGVTHTITLAEAIASCLIDGHRTESTHLAAASVRHSAPAVARTVTTAADRLEAHLQASKRAVSLGSIALAYSTPRRMASGHVAGAAYRSVQTWRGGSDLWPRGADYVPPHPSQVAPAMDDLVEFASRTDVDPIAQAALVHAQVRSIEPFRGDTDRVARACMQGVLRARGVSSALAVPISAALAANTVRYDSAWRSFRDGDGAPMVEMVAQAARRAARAAEDAANRVAALPAQWRERARPRRHSAAAALIPVLLRHPVVNATRVHELTGASIASSYEAISRLAHAGVLTRVSPTRRGTAWAALEVFDAAQELASHLAGLSTPRPRAGRPVAA